MGRDGIGMGLKSPKASILRALLCGANKAVKDVGKISGVLLGEVFALKEIFGASPKLRLQS